MRNLDAASRRLTLLAYGNPHHLVVFEDPDLPGIPLPALHLQGDAVPFGAGEVRFAIHSPGELPGGSLVAQIALVLAEGHLSPEEMFGLEPALSLPVIVTGAAGGASPDRPRILGIRYEGGAAPRAALELAVQPGRRYRIERAAAITGPWTPVADLTGKTDAEGEFVADQATVTCLVPCEPAPSTLFFRVRLN